ncbi:segregation and condensation protein B (plasmid) [Azospirillum humicireducens]|uniref:Segregation and condensation protein B n=1 Tax=Azospirillum humicireducens TaxID=1226968 RepID=A0A2R4VUA3_9PROT|nr:SMC-Scp complex subunit ScpB [Azospirillum humicireducens]AWB07994.1 segregation and condensation protein B [Azospirillum humicireducens]
MAQQPPAKKTADDLPFDRNLVGLPPELRWREWMNRVEAVIFASPTPVPRAVLARVVGDDCPLDAVIADIREELRTRPYDLMAVAGGWHHRTRPHLAPVLQAVRPAGAGLPALGPADQLLLATIAYHQPVTRRDLERLLGRTVDADAVGRLRAAGLVGPGPRSPRPGAPLTFVTTDAFLDRFGLESLADLPDLDDLRAMGLADTGVLDGTPAGAPDSPEPAGRASLPPAHRSPRPRPPAIDLAGPLAEVAATSDRVTARLQDLKPDDAGAASTDTASP